MNAQRLLQQLVGAALGVALLVAAAVFAWLLFVTAAVLGVGLWAWLWWRNRRLPQQDGPRDGIVIEGKYRVESESSHQGRRSAPPR